MDAQVRNPYTEELLPFEKLGDISLNDGYFNNYTVQYGLINHMETGNALSFVKIERGALNPWLVVLNGGPGRSNLRLSFELDSILTRYNVLIPGYRGVDDKIFESLGKIPEDSMRIFIQNNRKTFGLRNTCKDINLIARSLNIENLTILCHSFGTLISAQFATQYPNLVDTIFAFSPVDYNMPFPSPQKLESIFDSISLELGLDYGIVTSKIYELSKKSSSELFYIGMLSSLYTKADIENLINDIYNEKVTVTDLERRGKSFVNEKWLFDFGLKFCKIDKIPSSDKNIFYKLSNSFRDLVNHYILNANCSSKTISFDNLPVKLFIPELDFFYSKFDKHSHYKSCNCGHADFWSKAPKYILE